ncbi:hypothetical protein F5Y19DRAFT_169030 [Xylariaceae sp. FL1651]|nr:hypothetical protein F5Y19DRAFT_169030 [Xylariaceae sp. FL1651]
MKIRYRGPSGGGVLELAEDATVAGLMADLKSVTGSKAITVKFGWPLQTLAANQEHLQVRSLGLQRESLTVIPHESSADQSTTSAIAAQPGAGHHGGAVLDEELAAGMANNSGESIEVYMPESDSNLVLRVMPDDGDCMFTAVSGALTGLLQPGGSSGTSEYTPALLRRIVVDAIRDNPAKFDASFLGDKPSKYCERMLRSGVWGGAIELSILSEAFHLEICSFDVERGTMYHFGEARGYEQFCVVIYSGIHYDRVAETLSKGTMNMADFDVTRWNTAGNERVLQHSRELCKILHDRHYYTNVSDFVVTCNECGDILQGQGAIAQHARQTGHTGVTEVADK